MKMIVDYEAMGRLVRLRRMELRMTQQEVAGMTGVSTSFIGHIERGEKVPSLETVAQLARALDLSLDRLVFGVNAACDREHCALYADLLSLLSVYKKP